MRNSFLISSSLAVVLLPTLGSANLLTNGGFDSITGAPVPTNPGYRVVNAGGTDIIGWTVGGVSVDITVMPTYPVVSNPYSVDLAGTPGPGSLSQTINVGATARAYTVSFFGQAAALGGLNDGIVFASFGGLTQSFVLDGTMTQYSFTVFTSGSQIFSLSTSPTNGSNGNLFVDNASVTAVPGPASLATFGLTALAGLRKRRSKRA